MARHPRNDSTDADAGFVSRWSRRKQKSRERELDPGEQDEDHGVIDTRGAPLAGEELPEAARQEPGKTDADMPPLDSITESSNVADFLSPGVSEQLRKIALRKLFHTAKFNIRDGLDDYDEDFRAFAALGDIVTSDMKHQQELAEERAREQAEARSRAGEELAPQDDAQEPAAVSDAASDGDDAQLTKASPPADVDNSADDRATDDHDPDGDEPVNGATQT